MSHFAHKLAGFGTTLVLVGAMLAGCGGGKMPTGAESGRAPLARQVGMTPGFIKAIAPKGVKAASLAGDVADEPLMAPTDGGGLRPLPKPTPTPPPGKPGGGAEPDDVDELHRLLRNYGYRGSRSKLEGQVTAVTHQYALGWDPRVNPDQHFEWWKRTLDGIANTPADYRQQAIYLAQHKFDVVYYVWVSKQGPNQMVNGRTPPMVDFNDELPIVKGIEDEGLFVQLSPRGTIVDYLRLPSEYLNDYNHLIPIPRDLY